MGDRRPEPRVRVMPGLIAVGILIGAALIGLVSHKAAPALVIVSLAGMSFGVAALMARDGEYLPSAKPLGAQTVRLIVVLLALLGVLLLAVVVDGIVQGGHVATGLFVAAAATATTEGIVGLRAWTWP